jgi:acylphosphatase
MIQHFNITITGIVQGVNFRVTTKAVADQLGIRGYAMNLPDGTVYVEAEGEKWMMDEFLEWCAEGPDQARVEKVEQTEGGLIGFTDFNIRKHKD